MAMRVAVEKAVGEKFAIDLRWKGREKQVIGLRGKFSPISIKKRGTRGSWIRLERATLKKSSPPFRSASVYHTFFLFFLFSHFSHSVSSFFYVPHDNVTTYRACTYAVSLPNYSNLLRDWKRNVQNVFQRAFVETFSTIYWNETLWDRVHRSDEARTYLVARITRNDREVLFI